MVRAPGLTDRQLDVLELALRGLSNQQIGDRLYLSLDTVKTHFRRIYAELKDDQGRTATGALHAVALALEKGYLTYDPVQRRIVRPPDREALPTYADLERAAPQPGPERTVEERRRDLGW